MVKQLEAVYEAGVLRPLEPLPFAEKQHVLVTVSDQVTPLRTFNAREQEQAWLRDHSVEYAGQWVAVEGDRLVSHGVDARAVLESARSKGIAHPLLVQIANEPELPFGGW